MRRYYVEINKQDLRGDRESKEGAGRSMIPATALQPSALSPIISAFLNEADGIRTRNVRIDSPVL